MEPQDLTRLRVEITRELYAQLSLREHIVQENLTGVAEAVAAQLWRTFIMRWTPDWDQEPQGDDELSLDAATWRAG